MNALTNNQKIILAVAALFFACIFCSSVLGGGYLLMNRNADVSNNLGEEYTGDNGGNGITLPDNCGNVYAIDPKHLTALGATAPAGNIVMTETVDHNTRTITITYFLANQAVSAYTSGSLDFNLWYGYCTFEDAHTAALMQKAERESEDWANGYTVTIIETSVPVPSASCTEHIMAINPAFGNASTPTGVYAVVETVNYSAKTITIQAVYAESPVEAYILGVVHQNVWYGYCSLQSAQVGALSQKAERESEAKIVGGWADGFTVTLK